MPKKGCILCDGTGIYKRPNNEDAFDRLMNHYMDPGTYSGYTAYRKAINKVGYTEEVCECCKDDTTEQ